MKLYMIYESIIRGGPASGQPATFIQFGGDESRTIDDIVIQCEKYDHDVVVLEGDEPFSQDGIIGLISELYERGYQIDVETTGIVRVQPRILRMIRHTICTPKLGDDIQLNLKGKHVKLVVSVTEDGFWNPENLADLFRYSPIREDSIVYIVPHSETDIDISRTLSLCYKVNYSDE